MEEWRPCSDMRESDQMEDALRANIHAAPLWLTEASHPSWGKLLQSPLTLTLKGCLLHDAPQAHCLLKSLGRAACDS